jgi:hypothetical protein
MRGRRGHNARKKDCTATITTTTTTTITINLTAPLPPLVANKIYRSICIPKLTYGLDSCVLNDECLEELEKAHRYCSKKMQGLPPQTPIVATLAPLGLYTIESMMHYQLMLMLYRWLSLPYHSLYKKIAIARITYHMYGNGSHKGPIYEPFKACQTYGLLEYISDVLETGTTMKLLEWKKIVWKAVEEVEVSRWRASSILYSTSYHYFASVFVILRCQSGGRSVTSTLN